MVLERKKRVAEEIWNWRESGNPQELTHSKLRKRAVVPIVGLFLTGTLFRFVLGFVEMSWIPFILGSILFLIALIIPSWLLAIEAAVKLFAHWVGVSITWILLVPFFYCVFLPLRLIQLLSGADPMHRKHDTSVESYWIERKDKGEDSNLSMLKQY